MGKGTAGIWRPSSPYSRKRGVYMSFLSNILTGVSLGFNLFNALVTLVLGVPGLGLLLLVQWVLT